MRTIRAFLACCALQGLFSLPGLCAPQTGWWWNPAESGRGFFVESQDGITFIGAYLYNADGHAVWYVAGGKNADPYNYTGPLYNMSNGQTLFGKYAAPVGPKTVGTITVHFSDDTHGTVTWPGGTVAIEREIFGTGDADFKPYNGWWWNPDEGGSGYSIEVQGKNLFVVGFTYDDNGRAVWYFSAGPMSTPTTYRGDVLQFADGQTMNGPYHPPGSPTTVAKVDVVFTSVNQATLTFTRAAASTNNGPRQGEQSLRVIVPEFVSPLDHLPPQWTGSASLAFNSDTVQSGPTSINIHYTATVSNMTFVQDQNNRETYSLDLSKAKIAFTYSETEMAPFGNCTGHDEGQVSEVKADKVQALLSVTESGLYTLTMSLNVPILFTFDCPGPPPLTAQVPYALQFGLDPREGAVFIGILGAEIVNFPAPGGGGSARLDWQFAPVIKQ